MLKLLSYPTSNQTNWGDTAQSNKTLTLIYEISQQFGGSSATQCEAVAKTGKYLDQYPFPAFVTTLFGRLADLYVADYTNDFVRLQILKTFEESSRHLMKLTGVNVLFDKIFQVAYNTNDVARAITLRLLGNMSSVIPPVKADIVRHKIIGSLDSKSEEELGAALFAATKFARGSGQFSHQVFEKLMAKFTSVNTDFVTREKLAACIIELEYDDALFEKALKVTEQSLEVVVDRHSSMLLLKSLTKIAVFDFVYIPETAVVLAKALLNFQVTKDQIIILQLLTDLTTFAHQWNDEVIATVSTVAAKSNIKAIQAGCLHLFVNILKNNVSGMTLPPQIQDLALSAIRDGSFLSIHGSLLMIYSAVSTSEIISSPTIRMDLMTNFQFCFSKIITYRCVKSHQFLVSKLLRAIKLAFSKDLLDLSEFVCVTLRPILIKCLADVQYKLASALLSTLLPMISATSTFNALFMGEIFSIERLISLPSGFACLALKFLLRCYPHHSEPESNLIQVLLKSAAEGNISAWQLYRLANYAIQCKRLEYASQIIHFLRSEYSESLSLRFSLFFEILESLLNCYSELSSLQFTSGSLTNLGDSLLELQSKLADCDFNCRSLVAQEPNYQRHSSHQLVTHFRSSWIRLSISIICSFSDFLAKLCRLKALMSNTSGNDKYLRIMLKSSADQFSYAVDDLCKLRSVLIDGDDITLQLFDQCYHSLTVVQAVFMIIAIEGISNPAAVEEKISTIAEQLELRIVKSPLLDSLQKVSKAYSELNSAPGTELLLNSLGEFGLNACKSIAILPPMFFSVSQHTVIKLCLSPLPQVSGEPVIVLQDTAIILRVEGVIEQVTNSSKLKLRHIIKKVRISAKFLPKSVDPVNINVAKRQTWSLDTTESVMNDFFSTEFSFQPEYNDVFQVRLLVEAIDENGMHWSVSGDSLSSHADSQSDPQLTIKSIAHSVRTSNQTSHHSLRNS